MNPRVHSSMLQAETIGGRRIDAVPDHNKLGSVLERPAQSNPFSNPSQAETFASRAASSSDGCSSRRDASRIAVIA